MGPKGVCSTLGMGNGSPRLGFSAWAGVPWAAASARPAAPAVPCMKARRETEPRAGEERLRGEARLARHTCGEIMWLKIPCQDCHCVRRINLLLSCTLHCTVQATFDCSAEPCPRGILPPSAFQRPAKAVAPTRRVSGRLAHECGIRRATGTTYRRLYLEGVRQVF